MMPIFFDVDPSHVRKQKVDFGIAFEKTCEVETEEEKRRWTKALVYVATIAGEHSCNWFVTCLFWLNDLEHFCLP